MAAKGSSSANRFELEGHVPASAEALLTVATPAAITAPTATS